MPTSPYFRHANDAQDQRLHSELCEEVIELLGHDVLYLPRTLVKEDRIFGEDVLSRFERAYTVPMYFVETDGFGGQGDFLDRFGLNIQDQYTFQVGKIAFERCVPNRQNQKPNQGDWLMHPQSRKVFEITFVEDEKFFYTHGKIPVWELKCELVNFSNERISTGNPTIDTLRNIAFTVALTMDDGGVGNYTIDEEVTSVLADASIITAKVTSWDVTNRILKLRDLTGEFEEDGIVVGTDSGASHAVVSIADLNNANDSSLSDASELQEADDFRDTSPFGDY